MFLARTITRAKWEPKRGLQSGKISADAVTGDLRTRDNMLSFWQCPSGTDVELEDVVLAIATGREEVDKVEIVWLDVEDLRTDGQTLINSEGRTPVAELVSLHVDVCHLDYKRLGKVAHRVFSAFDEGRYCRLTRARILALLTSAVRKSRVDLKDLKEKVQDAVQKSLTTSK